MTDITSVASFRRVTPGIVASARLAMANDVPDVTKSEIALLLKRAAPVLGIDGTAYHVMDILLGLSRADDWKGAGRPIVAISNAKLAEYTMRSERTVMRCIRRLVEVGIAAYRDSATGRRFVYRDKQGDISVGYGIDFTPSRVRAEEIKAAVEQYQVKLNRELAAKRDISRLARAVQDLSKAFPENSATWRDRVAKVQASGLDLEPRAQALRELHAEIVVETTIDRFEHNLSCEGDISVTPNTYTTQESLYISNDQRTRSNERAHKFHNGSKAAEMAFEKKPAADDGTKQSNLGAREGRDPDTIQGEILGSVSIGLLQVGCREAQVMISTRFDNWSSLGRAGETLRRMIGLSEAGWADGRAKVGLYGASAILAIVLEKSLRDPEQISRPAGYFRAMIDRAVEGKLNLERSLFGLAGSFYGASGEAGQ
ncbi:plasmid replication protein RepCa2 (plasmid) [Rhizobium lusitanum]|uniref:plasmid replication protein RepC n=1 Tax=Rhizobium lusitanum TaxID=293958 RepID=UPI001622B474|nr:plasmid replication protein RepC [Rhizobium lusitanum]QND44366.1 plasmid replication protein RepCa2 [Rhizobium lusitanum]